MKKTFVILLLLYWSPIVSAETINLKQCRELALERNQNIRIAQEEVHAAESQRKSAYTHFLPSIGFTGSYIRTDHLLKGKIVTPELEIPIIDTTTGHYSRYQLNLPPQEFGIGEKNNFLLNFDINQPIYTGGKIRNQYEISKSLELTSRTAQRLKRSDIIFQTDERFWRLVSLREKAKLAEMYRSMIGRHVENLENLLGEGIITNNDLLKAKVAYNKADLNVFKARNGLKLSQMALCRLIGLPLDTGIVPAEKLESDFEKINDDGFQEKAVRQRAEINMLEEGIKISNAFINLQRSRYYPNLLLNGGYTFLNPDPYNNFESEFGGDWRIGLVCQMDIFHWNERGHDLDAARHQKKMTEYKLDETRELISLEVQQAIFKVNEAAECVSLTAFSLEQSEENLRVTEENFKEGITTNTEVLDAQTLWKQAYTEQIEAKTDYILQRSAFARALGELD